MRSQSVGSTLMGQDSLSQNFQCQLVHLGYNLSVSWQTYQKLSLASSSGLWVGQLASKNIKREWGHIALPLVPRHSAPGTDQMAFLQFPNLEFLILQSHLHIPVRRKRKDNILNWAVKWLESITHIEAIGNIALREGGSLSVYVWNARGRSSESIVACPRVCLLWPLAFLAGLAFCSGDIRNATEGWSHLHPEVHELR